MFLKAAMVLSCNLFSQGNQLQYTTATTGTVTINDMQQNVQLIHDAGTTLTLTIAFPATPFNGMIVSISSTNGITTLSLTATVGSIINGVGTMTTGGNAKYQYLTAQTKWYKIQ